MSAADDRAFADVRDRFDQWQAKLDASAAAFERAMDEADACLDEAEAAASRFDFDTFRTLLRDFRAGAVDNAECERRLMNYGIQVSCHFYLLGLESGRKKAA